MLEGGTETQMEKHHSYIFFTNNYGVLHLGKNFHFCDFFFISTFADKQYDYRPYTSRTNDSMDIMKNGKAILNVYFIFWFLPLVQKKVKWQFGFKYANFDSYGWRFNVKALLDNAEYILSFPEIHNSNFASPVLFIGGGKSDHIQ